MSHTTEKPSARSGRVLLGAAGIAMLSGIGIVETSNMDLRTANHGLNTQVVGLKGDVTQLTTTLDGKNRDIAGLNTKVEGLNKTVAGHEASIVKNKQEIAKLGSSLEAANKLLKTTEAALEAGGVREKKLNDQIMLAARLEATLKSDIAAGMKREESHKATIASLEKVKADRPLRHPEPCSELSYGK